MCTTNIVVFSIYNLYFSMILQYAGYNVNDLRKIPKRKSIFYLLKQKQYDMVFLQETHSCPSDEKLWACEWGKIIFAHGKNNSRGVSILFKYSLKFELGTIKIDSNGRFILVDVKINNTTFVMENVYAPVNDVPKFFDSLFSAITKFPNNDLILARDWNLILNNQLDKDGRHPHANKNSKERLKSYMKFFNLNDVFCNFFPSKKFLREFNCNPILRHVWIFF